MAHSAVPFSFAVNVIWREVNGMGVRTTMKSVWERLAGVDAAAGDANVGERKTAVLPSNLSPYQFGRTGQSALPKPTPANLRKFAETPVVRRAINVVKDKIASMDWQVRVRRGYSETTVEDAAARMAVLRRCLEEPNVSDSFRVLWEQVIEDLLVGGFGAVEMEATGDPLRPFHLWAVDGATIRRSLDMRRPRAIWAGRVWCRCLMTS